MAVLSLSDFTKAAHAGPRYGIGCLHVGDGGSTDNFARCGGEREFGRFLDFVEDTRGSLLIAGDLFEGQQSNLSAAVTYRPDLLDRLSRITEAYTPGNHDRALRHFRASHGRQWLSHPLFGVMADTYRFLSGGRKFVVLHGHQTDPSCDDDAFDLDSLTAALSALVERYVGSPMLGRSTVEALTVGRLERLLDWAGRLIGRPTAMEAYNRRLIAKYGSDGVVIHAHTHVAGVLKNATGLVCAVNVGTWAEPGKFSFCRIATDGTVALFDWVDGSPVENRTVLPW